MIKIYTHVLKSSLIIKLNSERQEIIVSNLIGNMFYLMARKIPKSLQMVIAAMKLEDTHSLERKLWPT